MNKSFFIGCLAGGLVGLASGLLCAPQSGSDLIHNALNRHKTGGKRKQGKEQVKDNDQEDHDLKQESTSFNEDDAAANKDFLEENGQEESQPDDENLSEGKKKGSKKKTTESIDDNGSPSQ